MHKKVFLFGLFIACLAPIGLLAKPDSVQISAYIRIEKIDERKWIERHQEDIDKYIKENNQMNDFSCDALFLGSSSINLWKTLQEDMAPMKVIKRSYGGSTIRDILYNYNVIAHGYDPNCIVLYVENDITSGKEGIPEYEVFDLFRVFIQRIQQDYPKIPLYIVSFKPSFARQGQLEKQKNINYLLRTYAENTADVEFIDITQAMYNTAGNLREDIFIKDRLHLNAKGYEIWTSIIKSRILKHKSDDLPAPMI
jgi:hypothetical protein